MSTQSVGAIQVKKGVNEECQYQRLQEQDSKSIKGGLLQVIGIRTYVNITLKPIREV